MRVLLALAAILLLGSVAAACAFWAGVTAGGPVAFALGGFLIAVVVPMGVGQLGNWGVPGDEPRLHWRGQL